jgi:hypothetical protein
MKICGIEFNVGDKWKECDKRFDRIVEVVGWNAAKGKIQLKSNHRYTWASAKRFNGKGRGYARVSVQQVPYWGGSNERV